MIKDLLGWKAVLLEGQPLRLAVNISILLFCELYAFFVAE